MRLGVAALTAAAGLVLVVGARRNRPLRRSPWYLLAGAVALFTLGTVAEITGPGAAGQPGQPGPLHLLGVGAVTVALLRLVRWRTTVRDWAVVPRILEVALALGALAWLLLILPDLHDAALPVGEKLSAATSALVDVVLATVLLRLWPGLGRRDVAGYLLAASVAVLLGADVVANVVANVGAADPQTAVLLGQVLFGLLAALAALHPSMRRLTEPTLARSTSPERWLVRPTRWVAFALTQGVIAVPIARWALGHRPDVAVMIGNGILVVLALVAHMSWRLVLQPGRDRLDLAELVLPLRTPLVTQRTRRSSAVGEVSVRADGPAVERDQQAPWSALQVLQQLAGELRPAALEPDGLPRALQRLVRRFRRTTQATAELEVHLLRTPPKETEAILYYAAREALANTAQHAKASRMHVTVISRPDAVELSVFDDGVGFDPALDPALDSALVPSGPDRHLGLQVVRELAVLAGGHMVVASARGGTTVTVSLPLLLEP
jgi:two-component sensor histidine kinase